MSSPSETPLKQVLAAFTGFQIASFASEKGQHCIVVYDDILNHWEAYSSLLNQNSNNYGTFTQLYSKFLNSFSQPLGSITSWSILSIPEEVPPSLEILIERLEQIVDKKYFYDRNDFSQGEGSALWNLTTRTPYNVHHILQKSVKSISEQLHEIEKAELSISLIRFVDPTEEIPQDLQMELEKKIRLKTIFYQAPRSPLSIHEQNFLISSPVLNLFYSLSLRVLAGFKDSLLTYLRNPDTELHQEKEFVDLISNIKLTIPSLKAKL